MPPPSAETVSWTMASSWIGLQIPLAVWWGVGILPHHILCYYSIRGSLPSRIPSRLVPRSRTAIWSVLDWIFPPKCSQPSTRLLSVILYIPLAPLIVGWRPFPKPTREASYQLDSRNTCPQLIHEKCFPLTLLMENLLKISFSLQTSVA